MQNINKFPANSCLVYLFQWEARAQTGFHLLSAKFYDPSALPLTITRSQVTLFSLNHFFQSRIQTLQVRISCLEGRLK